MALPPPVECLQTPPQTKLFTDEHIRAPYMLHTTKSSFTWDQGLAQLPLTSQDFSSGQPQTFPNPTSIIVQTAAPTGTQTVAWKVTRDGDWPDIPAPQLPGSQGSGVMPNAIFAGTVVELNEVQMLENGIYRFSLAGTHHYLLQTPITGFDGKLALAGTPYDQQNPANGPFFFPQQHMNNNLTPVPTDPPPGTPPV